MANVSFSRLGYLHMRDLMYIVIYRHAVGLRKRVFPNYIKLAMLALSVQVLMEIN